MTEIVTLDYIEPFSQGIRRGEHFRRRGGGRSLSMYVPAKDLEMVYQQVEDRSWVGLVFPTWPFYTRVRYHDFTCSATKSQLTYINV